MSFNRDDLIEFFQRLRNELDNRLFMLRNGHKKLDVKTLMFLAQHLEHRNTHSTIPDIRLRVNDYVNFIGTYNVDKIETVEELIINADKFIQELKE